MQGIFCCLTVITFLGVSQLQTLLLYEVMLINETVNIYDQNFVRKHVMPFKNSVTTPYPHTFIMKSELNKVKFDYYYLYHFTIFTTHCTSRI